MILRLAADQFEVPVVYGHRTGVRFGTEDNGPQRGNHDRPRPPRSSFSSYAKALTLGCLLLLGARVAAAQVVSVQSTTSVARLTGPGSINATEAVAVGGTDLGILVEHQGAMNVLFGDTFSSDLPTPGTFWRRNTMARSVDFAGEDGITFSNWVTNASGQARELFRINFPDITNTVTEIPTGAISIGDRLFVWYMAVNWWGPPGQWSISYSGLTYTDDGGQSFTPLSTWRRPTWTNFGMVGARARTDVPEGADPYIYVWGTPAGRLGGVKLARVLPGEIANLSAYQYFAGMNAGTPSWTASEVFAPAIVEPPVGELSVMYNRAARRWLMLYMNVNTYAIEMRQSIEPWGPWSAPLTVATGTNFPQLYAPYMHPRYVEDDGRVIYFTMSLFGPYDVYWMKSVLQLAPCATADIDHDGAVRLADLATLLTNFGTQSGSALAMGDIDGNGSVDLADLAELLRHFGSNCDD